MPGIGTTYNQLITQIITDLKTITELVTDGDDVRVHKWKVSHEPMVGRYEAVVMAGPMEILGGVTTHATDNRFTVIVDLLHYAEEYEQGFVNALTVAEKIYDKFHLKNISSLVRLAKVSLFPGDGELSRDNLLAIPIRILIQCDRVIIQ